MTRSPCALIKEWVAIKETATGGEPTRTPNSPSTRDTDSLIAIHSLIATYSLINARGEGAT